MGEILTKTSTENGRGEQVGKAQEKVSALEANVTKERRCHEGFLTLGEYENGGAINRKGKRGRTSGGGNLFEHAKFHLLIRINVAMQKCNSESHGLHSMNKTSWSLDLRMEQCYSWILSFYLQCLLCSYVF